MKETKIGPITVSREDERVHLYISGPVPLVELEPEDVERLVAALRGEAPGIETT